MWVSLANDWRASSALQSSTPSDLIIMDTNYEERVMGRRQILAENPSVAMGVIPEGARLSTSCIHTSCVIISR